MSCTIADRKIGSFVEVVDKSCSFVVGKLVVDSSFVEVVDMSSAVVEHSSVAGLVADNVAGPEVAGKSELVVVHSFVVGLVEPGLEASMHKKRQEAKQVEVQQHNHLQR